MNKVLLATSLALLVASCGNQTPLAQNPVSSAAPQPSLEGQAGTVAQKAPSRLRRAGGTSKVTSFATFYQIPDGPTLRRLAQRDLSIVQPNISPDQMRSLQTLGNAVAYLSIGELGVSNTYFVNGQAVQGQTLYNQRLSEGWFVGKNGNFGSYLLDLTKPAVRSFVVEQGRTLLGRGFDGLFLDTADDAEFFNNGVTTQPFTSGALTLYAGRPDYPTLRRAYIETIKALRVAMGSNLLVQNGGFDLLLERQNGGDGTQGYVDAVMHEVALTKSNKPESATDDLTWPNEAANYESWEQNYARNPSPTQAAADRAYRANRDALALEYFRGGGVVLQQDFAVPQNIGLQCLSYNFARDLRLREHKDGWVAAYSDASFNKLFDFVETSPAVKAVAGCSSYDYQIAPDFEVNSAPPALGVAAGRSTSSTLNVASVNGYTSAVSFALGTLPGGLSASLSQTSILPGPNARVTLTLSTGASVAAGTYIVPVRATSLGQTMVFDVRLTVYRTTGNSVWVAQAGTGTVLAFDSSAALTPSSPAPRSAGPAALKQPYAVAVDAVGNQFVAENGGGVGNTGKGRVLKYSPFGLYPGGEIGMLENLNYPTSLALDAQSRLWVVQSGLNSSGNPEGVARVSRFDGGVGPETSGFSVPSNLGFPGQVAVSGNTLWLTTTYGFVLRYDVSAAPTLNGIYSLGGTLDAFGGLYASPSTLWLSGTFTSGSTLSRVARVNVSALPVGNAVFGVDGSAAVNLTLSSGLYDPAGLAPDSLGNLWVVNKTGALGVVNLSSPNHGTLVRFPVAALVSSSAAPNLSLDLGSRFPVGIAVARP